MLFTLQGSLGACGCFDRRRAGCLRDLGDLLIRRPRSGSRNGTSRRLRVVALYTDDKGPKLSAEAKPSGSVAAASFPPVKRCPVSDAVLLQGFGWESWKQGGGKGWWGHLQELVPEMKAVGATHVWLPPPSQSVSPEGYLPGQLYNLNSKYGNREQLQALVRTIRENGMQAIADIVINHRCADKQDERGNWNIYSDDVDHLGNKINWGRWAITSDDPTFHGVGNPDTGDDYGAAPDLDHLNPDLRAALKDWLTWLMTDLGFTGWRFDFSRGYAARFTKEYVEATTGKDAFNVGEFWTDLKWNGSELDFVQDAARQSLCNWLDGCESHACAFDFPTKGILQEAVRHTQYWRLRDKSGKPPGLIGWWPGRAVTFIDNHDTGSTQRHWPFPDDSLGEGYAYILTHPGIPCLFFDHVVNNKDLAAVIKKLVALRRDAHIDARAKVDILCADQDMYVARVTGRRRQVILKMGPRFDMGSLYPKGWDAVVSGKNFAVWANAPMAFEETPEVPESVQPGQAHIPPEKLAGGEYMSVPTAHVQDPSDWRPIEHS